MRLALAENFAGIEQIVRVNLLLDGLHNINTGPGFLTQILAFALPHAMFAGAGAAHINSPLRQARRKGVQLTHHLRLVGWQ